MLMKNLNDVTLCDGRTGRRSALHVEISDAPQVGAAGSDNPPPALPVLDFTASDETLDRADEVIMAGGWRLDAYRRNPIFQNAHQYGDIIFTLGRALITEVRVPTPKSAIATPHLFQRIQFATDANPMARIAYALYKGKFLNAVSVGFIPIRWEDAPVYAPRTPLRRYLEQELLEVSAVGIPANPNALRLGLKAGAIDRADLRELLELLRALGSDTLEHNFRSQPAVPDALTRALGVRSYEAQWLQLAREVRAALKT
jgi:prohead serine protease